MPAGLIACLALGIGLVAPAAVRQPTKALLPKMVVPDASLARLSDRLRQKYAFYSTFQDAAASSPDPNDTGADLRRLGRIAGYVRGRNATGAFSRRAPKGLLVAGTSAILYRDARSAAASIKRDTADSKRLRGKAIEAGRLISFAATKVPSLGTGAVLVHLHIRRTGGTNLFTTAVAFPVGSLRGNTSVVRGDSKSADTMALNLGQQLRRRMLATLGGK
jgi:hypothetical protein